MQPTTQQQPSDTSNAQPKPKKKNLIIIAIIVGALIIIGGIVLLVLLLSKSGQVPGSQVNNQTARLTVGESPYQYACNAFSRDDIAEVFSFTDKNKVYINTNDAYNFTGKAIDLLELTGEENYGSGCDYWFNVSSLASETDNNIVRTYIGHYKDENAAQAGAAKYKPETGVKPLASFDANAYFATKADDKGRPMMVGSAVVDSRELYVEVMTKSPLNEAEATTKIDTLLKRAAERINDKKAEVAPNFDNLNTFEGHVFSDLCAHLDIRSVGKAMGPVEFRPTSIITRENAALIQDQFTPIPHFESSCNYRFRTDADKNMETNAALTYHDRYPHLFIITKQTYADVKSASASLKSTRETLKKPSRNGISRGEVSDVSIGEDAVKLYRASKSAASWSYYIQDENVIYQISVDSNTRTHEGFTSEGFKMTDEIAKKVYEQAQ